MVKILDTPIGWLKVRDSALSNGNIIAKVYPGETYQYTQEKDGWYNIILLNNETGWISAEYSIKISD
ncbi:MAG: SH3 domain-containing protein [Candidatus Staskawiczbacteria bacterium]|nr:SH3 domain-containing protein [Candidatus Staskawiczbacteria bacterium]